MSGSEEKDFLVYEGNKVPRVIRVAWTLLIIFGAIYLVRFALPDLQSWLGK